MAEPPKRRDVLTRRQVESVAAEIRRVLGDDLVARTADYGVDVEAMVAFGPVAAHVQQAREAEGLALKDLARELRVPQYRIRDIEGSRINEIDPDVLRRVIERFGLGEWYRTWADANPQVAGRLA